MPKGKDIFWEYATLNEEGRLVCNFCDEQYSGGITRFKYHLAGLQCHDVAVCTKVPENVKQMAQRVCKGLIEKPTKRGKMSSGSGTYLGSIGPISAASNSVDKGEGLGGPRQHQTISSMFKKQEKDQIDQLLFRAVAMNNLPFNLLRSIDFKNFVVAVSNHGPGYFPPSSETVRTKLLENAKKEVEAYVQEMKASWKQYGCTIMSDIWKDTIRSRSYMNLLISCPEGTIFWKAKHIENSPKNAELIVDFLSSTIEEIGPRNVIQIVTDNGSNYKRAKIILEERYPNIITTSCAAHCIDLMLEDIDSLENVAPIMRNARQIVKFIYNKQQALDIMRSYTKGAELKRPGATRFASHFTCLFSILKQEENLRFMVASNDWRHVEQVEKDDAREITYLIQNEDFWKTGREIIMFVEPLVKVLRMVDGEGATIGYLYESLDRVKEAIKTASKDKKEKYMPYWNIIDKRWNRNLHNPVHAAAAYLNPSLFWNKLVRMDLEVREGLDKVTKKLVSFDEYQQVGNELVKYHNRDPILFSELSMTVIHTTHPRVWWDMFGSAIPILQGMAIKLLSQPCSASACERNWSAFDAANTKKRNNLAPSRLTDLVFIRMNMHLQSMAPELRKMNGSAIYIEHVNPFSEEDNLSTENLSADEEEEEDGVESERRSTSRSFHNANEEDDSTSWDED